MTSDAQARISAARQARRAQIHRLRLAVVATGLALFIAVWAVIAVQMASGDDPALATRTSTTTPRSATSATSGDPSGDGVGTGDGGMYDDRSGSAPVPDSSSAQDTQSSAAAVRTGQS